PEGQRPRREVYRLKLLRQMDKAGIRPEWMVIKILPVIPPDLRPMVQLDGGRFAASDLNDLYRRVISRNNRLKRLIKEGAPEVILRNEKRMLQEAVDALLDNSARGAKAAMTASGRRPLRSLSDMLRGKQGRFRQNLLGKRVDYSGRSVIVIGPELKLHQCGIPKEMALEIFRPFVVSKLLEREIANNIKHANQLIEQQIPEVWEILGEIVKNYLVLLNRAPTLHRLGIQAFEPVLVEGKAIRIHPLICEAYNADFDGDQMAVFLPLSKKAQEEARKMMASVVNLLKPASGKPITTPNRDMVWGLYFLTYIDEKQEAKKYFGSEEEVLVAFYQGKLDVQEKIKVRLKEGEVIETSAGRVLLNQVLPKELRFFNEHIDKKMMSRLVSSAFSILGRKRTVKLLDDLKALGFYYATYFGATISMADIVVPEEKEKILREAEKEVKKVETQYAQGMITEEERHLMIVDIWSKAKNELEEAMLNAYDPLNPVYSMVISGSRGSVAQLSQLSGMKGLVVSPSGKIIDVPVKANYKEGLDVLEYFISSHGARKGRTDTALRTSESGYLTRRLVDVAQDIIIAEEDCGTKEGIVIRKEEEPDFAFALRGRVSLEEVKDKNGKVILQKGELISPEKAEELADKIEELKVRSPLTCQSPFGVCQKCYGEDLARGHEVELGTAIGIIAAQAIGEPGTQLTMRTFHVGGVLGEDITQGLPRVEQFFEARSPRTPAILAEESGKVRVVEKEDHIEIVLEAQRKKRRVIHLPEGVKLRVKEGQEVKEKEILAEGKVKITAPFSGRITALKGKKLILESDEPARFEWQVPPTTEVLVSDGDEVQKGDQLTEGDIDVKTLARLKGERFAQRYIINEINSVYVSQGQDIHPKHFEVIVRKMFSKAQVLDPGDSDFVEGQIVDRAKLEFVNRELKEKGKKPALTMPLVLGITKVALATDSFLSAASFQETSAVLRDAALIGKLDALRGIKENVIIGKLIPSGTGFIERMKRQKEGQKKRLTKKK
ncbi:DNA-directed RNA polymerase subunit beta', partial [bacterium]|nr:DNA-directed RNA polymerase subunit beta' [bacterium]